MSPVQSCGDGEEAITSNGTSTAQEHHYGDLAVQIAVWTGTGGRLMASRKVPGQALKPTHHNQA